MATLPASKWAFSFASADAMSPDPLVTHTVSKMRTPMSRMARLKLRFFQL